MSKQFFIAYTACHQECNRGGIIGPIDTDISMLAIYIYQYHVSGIDGLDEWPITK